MSELRRRMIQDMKLRGFTQATQESYLGSVRQVAKYYMRSPDRLSEEELRDFFLWLVQERQASPSTVRQYLSGIKFLYEHTLRRDWPTLGLIRPVKRWVLSGVLSREEVGDLLGRVKIFKHRVALDLIYACGLRLLQATRLHVTDVDTQRMQILVRKGKGGKDTSRVPTRSSSTWPATSIASPSPTGVSSPWTSVP